MTTIVAVFRRASTAGQRRFLGTQRAARSARCLAAAVMAASVVTAAHAPAAAQPGGFPDVTDGVHKPAIDALAARGLFDGTLCADGGFCPDEAIDRKTMAVWVVRAPEDDEPAGVDESRFDDVDADEWWAAHVGRFAELEITLGCATNPLRYCPEQPVNRGQMASFLVRALDLEPAEPAGFTDTEGNTHAADINALAAAGITAGCSTDPLQYCPTEQVTRAQMATFLARALGLIEVPQTQPTQHDATFKAVSAGSDHTCGLRTDNTITCWGYNGGGWAEAPAGNFKAVTAGQWHSCGLRTDNTITCWGGNQHGQTEPPPSTFKDITAGLYHTCGLRTDNTITCWGNNDGSRFEPPAGTFKDITAGRYHNCGLRTDNTVTCWGSEFIGRQGEAPAGTFKAAIAHLRGRTCALRTDNTITCWVSDLGEPDGPPPLPPAEPPAGTFKAIIAGFCGLRTDNTVTCWGEFGQGEPPAGTFKAITRSRWGACGLRTDNTVTCWGGSDLARAGPAGTFKAITYSPWGACGLRTDNGITCWGDDVVMRTG